jgi:hypothetical protein
MTTLPLTIDCPILLPRRRWGKRPSHQPDRAEARSRPAAGRVPRIARLMALALRCQQLLATSVISRYAELAALGHVSRARISQILNLLMLAPDIQEALLFLPKVERGRDPIHLRQLQPLAQVLDWRKQRRLWRALQGNKGRILPAEATAGA